jgi:magnesium transporter
VPIRHHETASEHLARRVPLALLGERTEAVLARLRGGVFDHCDVIFVVDERGALVGLARTADVALSPTDRPVEDLMSKDPPGVEPDTDQEKVATEAVRTGNPDVPVVDAAGRPLGIVPARSLIEILRHEHVEDIHRLAGIRRENRVARKALMEPPARRARHRLPWLVAGLAGSAVATFVVSRFERTLESHVAVAFFVPAIVYRADAIGTQTEAVVVRGLSLSEAPLWRMVLGELTTGLLIGSVLGAIAVPLVWFAFGDGRLAGAVGASVLVAGAIATTVGLLLPWCLSRAGVDPAFGSGPLATIIQDVLSLLVYFAVVTTLVH